MNKYTIMLAVCMMTATVGKAQSTEELRKEREELAKMSKSMLNENASKAAEKEAKKLEKEGWGAAPGALPMEKQLDRSYMMQMEVDDNLLPKYIMGEAMSVGANYDAAKMQALELAKQNLAGQIQTEITALIENTVANDQLGQEEAESIARSVMASKNLISQSIGRTLTVVELYRTLKNRNKEVLMRIAYSTNTALNIAKKVVKQDLEDKGDELHNKLDEIMGW